LEKKSTIPGGGIYTHPSLDLPLGRGKWKRGLRGEGKERGGERGRGREDKRQSV